MINIAGGTYIEHCIWPKWNEIYGSGLRAAASLNEYCKKKIHFHTFIPQNQQTNIQAIINSLGINFSPTQIDSAISFFYYHSLSNPHVQSDPPLASNTHSLTVKGRTILRFGFIEGDAVVHGDTVVYDPQSPNDPIPFRKNGSTAKRLALVLNECEAIKYLGKEKNLSKVIFDLKQKEKADVIVIKRGFKGCMLIDKNSKISHIPAYETDYVWKIGSGDIFSAFFTLGWAKLQLTPIKACNFASKATAYYCGINKGTLPIPKNFNKSKFLPLPLKNPKKKKKVYLAGPFFNMSQRWLIEEALAALKWDVDVFSPLHKVGMGHPAKQIYKSDIEGLNNCDIVLACLDDLDPGTIYEIGYAKAKNKPVIIYINLESSESLKMIEGSGCFITDDFTTAIYKTIWTAIKI